MEEAVELRDWVEVRELEPVAVEVALALEESVPGGAKVTESEAVTAAELEILGLAVALLLALAVCVLREERDTVPAALREAAAEPVACAESLGTDTVGAAVTLAEMVMVSDTSVGAAEPVEAALLLALSVPAAVPRTLPVVAALTVVVEEGERPALREAEGEAVAVGLALGLPVTLEVPVAL